MSSSARPGPVLQLTRHGPVWRDTHAVSRLRDAFSECQAAVLPALIEPALLARIHADIARATFREAAHGAIATELQMEANACLGLLQFLVNDPQLYRLIEDISGCRPLRMFLGRVYRRLPGRHFDSWHGDLKEARQVGMSVNLSTDRYDGGVFELRESDTERPLASIANTGLGDAHVFRIAPALEHRVTGVLGVHPKTAFAGWFGGTRDYHAEFRADPFATGE